MKAGRTRPTLVNKYCRRLWAAFSLALRVKEHREERREEYERTWAPHYAAFGARIERADQARAIREADMNAFIASGRAEITADGRVVMLK